MDKAELPKKFEDFCKRGGHRMTAPRVNVLEIIFQAKKPVTAYEILDLLGQKMDNPKPPTAYRAIEFLQKHSLIHRIESLNAYTPCHIGHKHKGSQFMICSDCGGVEETHLCDVPEPFKNAAKNKNFSIESWNLEIHGLCENCNDKD